MALRDKPMVAATALIILVILVSAMAPWIAPYRQDDMDVSAMLTPPGPRHLLGTDNFGRDVLSRIIYGARISVLVGVLSTLGATVLGVAWGTVAGYFGGWIDELSSRFLDIMFAFPYIVLAMALVALIGPGTTNVVLVIAIIRVPMFARLTRGSLLSIKQNDYVVAARALGNRDHRIMVRHLLPNLVGPVLVLSTLTMATAINTEAALSFLGLGVTPPQSSWGTVLADGRNYIWQAPWISTFAGVAISLTVLGFNLLGDGLRDLLDPRLQREMGKST